MRARLAIAVLAVCGPGLAVGGALPAPMTVVELRETTFDAVLTRVRTLDPGPGFTAYLVSYAHSGLTLYALIAVPLGEQPARGFPVVIANHGYVPDPRKYGITADGVDARPGDYYRSVPSLFASRGFLTVMPDYRGHNSSEGFEYVDPQDEDAAGYYAEDVVALLSAVDQIAEADAGNVFMWSHSMGGLVSMRALLATDLVKASSFWSTMNVDEFEGQVSGLDGPVVVHHAEGDETTPFSNSRSLSEALESAGLLAGFYPYPEADHYFDEDRRESAADTDAAHFRSVMR